MGLERIGEDGLGGLEKTALRSKSNGIMME